jgi:hypothetical protein
MADDVPKYNRSEATSCRALRLTSPCKGEVGSHSDPGGGPATHIESAERRDPLPAPSAPASPLQGEESGTAVPNNKT